MKKLVLVIAVLLMSLGLKAQVIPTSNVKVRSGNLSLADREKIIAFCDNNIDNLNAEIKKIKSAKEKELTSIKSEKQKFAVNGKPKLLAILTGNRLQEVGDVNKQNAEIIRINKFNENAQVSYEEKLKEYDTKISNIESKYDKEIYTKTTKIESCDSMKLVVMSKLVDTDSLTYLDGNFNGSAYNTSHASKTTAQAEKVLKPSTTSSAKSTTSNSSNSNCGETHGYKGTFQNLTQINPVNFKVYEGDELIASYSVNANNTVVGYLPAGEYTIKGYDGSNLIYAQSVPVDPGKIVNNNGDNTYFYQYVKYKGR